LAKYSVKHMRTTEIGVEGGANAPFAPLNHPLLVVRGNPFKQ